MSEIGMFQQSGCQKQLEAATDPRLQCFTRLATARTAFAMTYAVDESISKTLNNRRSHGFGIHGAPGNRPAPTKVRTTSARNNAHPIRSVFGSNANGRGRKLRCIFPP